MSRDALVIGGGHNGLACAVALARAGRRVTVIERRRWPGGLATMAEFHDGFLAPGLLHDRGLVRPWVVDALDLERHGLRTRPPMPGYWLAPDRPPIAAPTEHADVDDGSAVSRVDRAAWLRWHSLCRRVAPALAALMDAAPPDVTPDTASGLLPLVQHAFRLARLSDRDLFEVARSIPISLQDLLDDWFDDPRLKAALAFPALEAVFGGPRSPGTGFGRLWLSCLSDREVAGGPAALVDALLSAAKSLGVEIRCGDGVAELLCDRGRVVGARLDGGAELRADTVVSSVHPRATLVDLLPFGVLTSNQAELARNLRGRGTAARLLLALSGPLELRDVAGPVHRATITEDLDHLERAFDDAKYGRFSDRPAVELRVPSLERPDLAPTGKHVVSVAALHAPRDLDGGWNDTMREGLAEAILDELEPHAPTLRERIVGWRLVTPVELEDRFSLPGGHLHHLEHALDQLLFLRPDEHTSRYRTPVNGLFLTGAGTHPGGGLSGAPGVLAARAVLGDTRR